MTEGQDQSKLFAKVVAKAWGDEDFKRRLLADPAAVMVQKGLEVPEGFKLVMHEDTDDTLHLTLPASPPGGDITDLEAREAAGSLACCYPYCY